MRHGPKAKARGYSVVGVLLFMVCFSVLIVPAVRITQAAFEYRAILNAVNLAQYGSSEADVRLIFERNVLVDNIESIDGSDLVLKKMGDKTVVSFDYEREIHLLGPAYLTLKYSGHSE